MVLLCDALASMSISLFFVAAGASVFETFVVKLL